TVRAAIPERGEVRPSGRSPSPGRSGAAAARLHVRRERGLAGRRERAAHRPRPGSGADHTGRPEFHGGRAPGERRATLGVSPGFGAVLRLGAVAERRRECSRCVAGQPGARPVAYARHERVAGQVQLLAGAVTTEPRTPEAQSAYSAFVVVGRYPFRSAMTGSTAVARRAGPRLAIRPTAASVRQATASVSGSRAPIPNTSPCMNRVSHNAPTAPIASPIAI